MKFPSFSYMKLVTGILLLTIPFASCEKLLEIPPPVSDITKDQLFTDSATISANMTGLYSRGFLSTEIVLHPSMFLGMAGDEIFPTNLNSSFSVFYQNAYLPPNTNLLGLWGQPYAAIYHANGIIENLPSSTAISGTLKKQYIAEAKFMRAFQYDILTGYFGDVPLVLTTDVTVNASLPRTARAKVYEQMIKDLNEAIPDLNNKTNFTRVTPYAASALLARLYNYQKNWSKAAEMSSKAMEGPFNLTQDLTMAFVRGSKEAILQASSDAGGGTLTGFTRWGLNMGPPANVRSLPPYALTPTMLAAFEAGDKRRTDWITDRTVNGQVYAVPFKYRLRAASAARQEEYIFLRLTEQMLIKAEALAELNDLEESKKYVDTVRTRAGLGKLNGTPGKDELLVAIDKERRTELFLEAERWSYLYNKGTIDVVMKAAKPNWKAAWKLFPVPHLQRTSNINLSQNDGYE